MKERRKHVRVLSNLDLRYKLDDTKPHKLVRTKDVGGGGIRFLAGEKIPPGMPLKLEIDVPGSRHTIAARGQVVWCKQVDESSWEIATEFLEIDPRDQNKIMRLVFFSRKGAAAR